MFSVGRRVSVFQGVQFAVWFSVCILLQFCFVPPLLVVCLRLCSCLAFCLKGCCSAQPGVWSVCAATCCVLTVVVVYLKCTSCLLHCWLLSDAAPILFCCSFVLFFSAFGLSLCGCFCVFSLGCGFVLP